MPGIPRLSLFLIVTLLAGCAKETGAPADSKVVEAAFNAGARPADMIRQPARVFVGGTKWVYLAVDRTATDEMMDAQNTFELDVLRRRGKAFRVPVNTFVEVVGREDSLTKVRVAKVPERVYTGREGWLRYEYVLSVSHEETNTSTLPWYSPGQRVP